MQLSSQGYKESDYRDTELFEDFLDCGEYAFTTTTEEKEGEEIDVDVIEIQHFPEASYVKNTENGLIFIGDCESIATRMFAVNRFGFELGLVHSICMYEGQRFIEDRALIENS